MFWIRSGLHGTSISDWLTAGPAAVPDASGALDDAREAMVEALGTQGERKFAALALRIRKSPDLNSLWAIRPDLLYAACRLYGEAEGRKKLAKVTGFFEGFLPAAVSRRRGASSIAAAR